MKLKEKCPECGKQLRNRKALAGHMWMAHDIRIGNKAEVERLKKENEEINNIKEEVTTDGKAIEEIRGQLMELKEILLNGLKPHKEEIIDTSSEKTEEKEKTFWEKLDEWLL